MSRLGRVAFRTANDSFLDSGGFAGREYGERTAWEIDREVKSLVDAAAEEARRILVERKDLLVEVATRLLEKETMTGDELREIVGVWAAKAEKSAQTEKEAKAEKSAQTEKSDGAEPTSESV
jgi:cell division protease FtsH